MPGKMLSLVKVLECCHLVAGPYCSKLLADLGAEVVKIEQPGAVDFARRRCPFLNDIPHNERSGLFLYLNTNKLGITLNLEDQKGRDIFLKLVESVDILIEDQRPGFWSNLGLGYEQLNKVNDRLVMTSITPFGQTGPYRNFKCYPLNLFHAGGEGHMTPGWGGYDPGRPPLGAGKYVGEYESGLSAAVATMGAYYCQQVTGKGQHVDVSQQQSLMALNPSEIRYYPNLGAVASRATRTLSFGGILPCKDGYVELSIYEEPQWLALLKLMDGPEWAQQDKFKDRISRSRNNAELNSLLAEWLKHHTKGELYQRGQALGVPITPYNNAREVVASSQLAHRAFFMEIEHPEAGKALYPSAPYKFSEAPWRVERPAPLLGQHNEEIYGKCLGFSREQMVKLRQSGVI